jgi:hypothetical protein
MAGLLGALLKFFGLSVWECGRCAHEYVVFGANSRSRNESRV